MLNKDQYNYDEYNDYYKKEREGVKIKGYREKESGFMGKAILFLGLVALGVAGYFGFKAYNSTTEDSNSVTKDKIVIKEEPLETTTQERVPEKETIEDKIIKTIAINSEKSVDELKEEVKIIEEKPVEVKPVEKETEKTIQQKVIIKVQGKVANDKTMSAEDISKIVGVVINKINKEKTDTSDKDSDDSDLLNALEKIDNDTVEVKSKENEVSINNLETTIEKNIESKAEKVNTYNKVTLNSSSINNDKDLDELSKQIKKLLNKSNTNYKTSKNSISNLPEATTIEIDDTPTSNYKKSISKEVKVRSNAMRIIVVRKGDTLYKIAKRAYGKPSTFQKIYDANPDILNRADRIYVGQKLRIPK